MCSASARRSSANPSQPSSSPPSYGQHSPERVATSSVSRKSTLWKRRTEMSSSPLHELSEHGVSVWFDTLSRELLETGALQRMTIEDAVVGVTSNPTIFQKALAEGDLYDEQLREVAAQVDDATEIFFAL